MALIGLAALAVSGCGSGSRTVTVTTGGESASDAALQECLRAVYGTEDREPGEVQRRAAECLGVAPAVIAENPVLNACLAVATGLRDPRRFGQRVDGCRQAFENTRFGRQTQP